MRANRVAFTARRPAAWPASIRTTVVPKRKRHGRTHDPRSREGLARGEAAFAAATQLVGTTPSNAIRMFIAAFNRCGTFPFDISPNGAFGKECPQQLVVEERPQ